MTSTDGRSAQSPQAGLTDMRLKVVTLPVTDVDRAKSFFQGLGWRPQRRLPHRPVHGSHVSVRTRRAIRLAAL
jgi:hypothetical protein